MDKLLVFQWQIDQLFASGEVDLGPRIVRVNLKVDDRVLIGLDLRSANLEVVIQGLAWFGAKTHMAEVTVCLPNFEHCPQPSSPT